MDIANLVCPLVTLSGSSIPRPETLSKVKRAMGTKANQEEQEAFLQEKKFFT